MKKVIVIVGQTASGKTALAVKIARKFNGEIISADSRQVYRHLDIGTDKIKKKDMKGIPHHLIDVSSPLHKFTVTEFKDLAEEKIKEILKKRKTPIIAGGTGFYIDAITKGIIFPDAPPNRKLRKKLSALSAIALFGILRKLDPRRAKEIDPKNTARLIRAVEIAKHLGKVPRIVAAKPKYSFIKIGLKVKEELLRKRIAKRAEKQFRAGLMKEIKKLKKLGVTDQRLKEFGYEYSNPTRESITTGTWKYAKRQDTWFKRDKKIKWFSPAEYGKIEKYLRKLL